MVDVGAGRRRRNQIDHGIEQESHTEIGERRAEEHGRQFARFEPFAVEFPADGVEQFDALAGFDPRVAFLGGGLIEFESFLGRDGGTAGHAGEANELVGLAVDDTAELLAVAHRPGHRHRFEYQLLFDLVEQFEGVA